VSGSQALALREQECRDLEEALRELQDKTELALANIEAENEERENELAGANQDIKRLTEQILALEDDAEQLQAELARAQAEYQDDRERLQALNQGFKQVRAPAPRPPGPHAHV
jgi:predicted  nucleic acid-binding Zn-ribbon protein